MAARSERPRSKSMLSFGSTRSHKSSGSVPKIDLTESAKEKSSRKITSKADPSTAMNEAQPAAQALEKSTIESIRSIQHRDIHGNIITDPDLSNPTRPRLERPLDTIRSFEAAIDGSYSNRRSYIRPDTADPMSSQSRRSSYFQGYSNGNSQQRFPVDGGGYYGNRVPPSRPDSYIDNYANPNGQRDGRRFGPRNHSDPALYGQNSQAVYPSHGYQQSYDTVTSASGTGSHATDQWGNSTDPSSENSSIDRIQQQPKPDLGEAYGFSGFGGAPQFSGPILEEHGHDSPSYGQPGYGQSQRTPGIGYPYQGNIAPPAPPPHAVPKEYVQRAPIKLGSQSGRVRDFDAPRFSGRPETGEKRQSWLKRRFSKKE